MPETYSLDEFAYGLGSEYASVVTYELVWQTFDADACPKCQMLNGETWTLPSLTGTLISESQGAVYDLDADICITHPNCRCFLHVTPMIELENTQLFRIITKTSGIIGEEVPSNIEEAKRSLSDLKENALMADMTLRQYERVLYRVVALTQRLGLPPELSAILTKVQQVIMTIRMLTVSLSLLEMSTPYGMISGAIGLVGVALSTSEFMMEMGS